VPAPQGRTLRSSGGLGGDALRQEVNIAGAVDRRARVLGRLGRSRRPRVLGLGRSRVRADHDAGQLARDALADRSCRPGRPRRVSAQARRAFDTARSGVLVPGRRRSISSCSGWRPPGVGGMTKPDTITGDQRSVLAKLAPLLQDGFYLVGGVEIAARLAHRTSRDLDLFATRDPTVLQTDLARLPSTTIEGRAPGTMHLKIDGVPVSLIEYRYPLLMPTETCADLPVPVASATRPAAAGGAHPGAMGGDPARLRGLDPSADPTCWLTPATTRTAARSPSDRSGCTSSCSRPVVSAAPGAVTLGGRVPGRDRTVRRQHDDAGAAARRRVARGDAAARARARGAGDPRARRAPRTGGRGRAGRGRRRRRDLAVHVERALRAARSRGGRARATPRCASSRAARRCRGGRRHRRRSSPAARGSMRWCSARASARSSTSCGRSAPAASWRRSPAW